MKCYFVHPVKQKTAACKTKNALSHGRMLLSTVQAGSLGTKEAMVLETSLFSVCYTTTGFIACVRMSRTKLNYMVLHGIVSTYSYCRFYHAFCTYFKLAFSLYSSYFSNFFTYWYILLKLAFFQMWGLHFSGLRGTNFAELQGTSITSLACTVMPENVPTR